METINRNSKDTLFRMIFGDHKENALALYNAINGTCYTNADDLTVRTIKDAVYLNIENDVAFVFNDSMDLYEHQSTYNPNMPLRGLEYFSVLYSNYVDQTYDGRAALYKASVVHIPAPHYYVFYNGVKKQPESMDLHLSRAFDGDGDVEVTAHVINVNKGENAELIKGCKPLADYSELIYRIRRNKENGMSDEKAVKDAVDSCIEDNVLKDVLQEDENRAISSLLTALTQEEIDALHESELKDAREQAIAEGREEGRKEGREEGREEGIAEGVKEERKRMISKLIDKLSEEELFSIGFSEDEIEKAKID